MAVVRKNNCLTDIPICDWTDKVNSYMLLVEWIKIFSVIRQHTKFLSAIGEINKRKIHFLGLDETTKIPICNWTRRRKQFLPEAGGMKYPDMRVAKLPVPIADFVALLNKLNSGALNDSKCFCSVGCFDCNSAWSSSAVLLSGDVKIS